jgi:NAD(P)-dependent dehydrogenase (short-subunit alcohol dehydrogenase family)
MLKGMIAIVTGAAGGMGVAHMQALAEAGRGRRRHRRNRRHCRRRAGRPRHDRSGLDVTDPSSWPAVVTLAEERFGPVTTRVNNAEVLARGSVTELDPADWERILAVNLTGCYLGMRAAIPSMPRAGDGSIVSIASVSGIAGGLRFAAYNASKGGLITLTKGVARSTTPSTASAPTPSAQARSRRR